MPDIDDRFRSLDRVRPPDLWKRIEGWEECEPLESRPRRLQPAMWRKPVAVFSALAVAAAAIAFAVVAFSGAKPKPKPLVAPPGVQNGPLVIVTAFVPHHTPGKPYGWGIGSWFSVNADGSSPREIPHLTGDGDPAVSPDGTMVAFFGPSPHGGGSVWVAMLDGSHAVRLTHDSFANPHGAEAGNSGDPSWSPDGHRIAFMSPRNGCDQVFVMNADGSDQHAITKCGDYGEFAHPVWSPDGAQIAIAGAPAVPGAPLGIWVMNSDGSGMVPVDGTQGSGDGAPVWSPDGNRIAFWRGPSLMTIHVEGGRPIAGTTLFTCTGSGCLIDEPPPARVEPSVAWSPDGRFLAFVAKSRLFTVPSGGGPARQVPLPSGLHVLQVAWGPKPGTATSQPMTTLVSSSALLRNGRERCTAAVPSPVLPGEFTHIRVTLENLTNATVPPSIRGGTDLEVYRLGDGRLWNPFDVLRSLPGPAPGPSPALGPLQATQLSVLDPPVVWSGGLELRAVCLGVPLPSIHVRVAVFGTSPSAGDAVGRALSHTGGTLADCRPGPDGRWVTGHIPATGGGHSSATVRCRAVVQAHPGFDVVWVELVAPASTPGLSFPATGPLMNALQGLRGRHQENELGRWTFVVTARVVVNVEGPDEVVVGCGGTSFVGGAIGGKGGSIEPLRFCGRS